MFYTYEEIHEKSFKDKIRKLFDDYKIITLIYAKEIDENSYKLFGNVNNLSNNFIKDFNNIFRDNQVLDVEFEFGDDFKTLLLNKYDLNNSEIEIFNNKKKYKKQFISIGNENRCDEFGVLGFFFRTTKSKNIYFATNQHVIGTLNSSDKDTIQKLVEKYDDCASDVEDIGNYTYGDITYNIDFAFGTLKENLSSSNTEIELLYSISIKEEENLHVAFNNNHKVISTYSFVRIKDSYLYGEKGKVLEDLILTDIPEGDGFSGSVAFNNQNEVTSILLSRNNGYSVLCKLDNILNYISSKLKVKRSEITIINLKI